jgi:YhcH/YjgK/YiaL family protein
MILDLLEHWRHYAWPRDGFEAGFRFLETLDPALPDGRYAIAGDDVYSMIQTYETRPREGHAFEAHRTYADIQCLLAGEESILWAPVAELTVTKPYEPDIEFYALTPAPADLVLAPGRFCVFFPRDAHAPCTIHGASCTVRKAVVKVKLAR